MVLVIDIESLQNRLLKFCYVPTTSTGLNRLLFLMRLLTVLMKQTRQALCAVKQSILLRCLWLKCLTMISMVRNHRYIDPKLEQNFEQAVDKYIK
jgi:hypothetical protein